MSAASIAWLAAGLAAAGLVALLVTGAFRRQSAAMRRQQRLLEEGLQRERDQLEVQVARRTAELTELAQHLQRAREEERARLARDLHDELGALLTSAKLDAARTRSRLSGGVAGVAGPTGPAGVPEALERLAHLVETLNSGIALKRRIIEDLHPTALVHLGLVETLAILAREFTERSGVEVICELAPVALSPAAELVVYRVVQEAINNISKHAHATRVWITLAAQAGDVRLSVRDDGRGFDTTGLSSTAHGLIGMRFRVEAEHGGLRIQSQPGAGCTLHVQLPAASAPTPAR